MSENKQKGNKQKGDKPKGDKPKKEKLFGFDGRELVEVKDKSEALTETNLIKVKAMLERNNQ